MQESIVFLVRVKCRRKESSRSLSYLLMSFLYNLSHAICYSYGTDNKRGTRPRDRPKITGYGMVLSAHGRRVEPLFTYVRL